MSLLFTQINYATVKPVANKPAAWRLLSATQVTQLPRTRRAAGEYYFTGVPCINGHTHARITKTKRCVLCDADRHGAPHGDVNLDGYGTKTIEVFGIKRVVDCEVV